MVVAARGASAQAQPSAMPLLLDQGPGAPTLPCSDTGSAVTRDGAQWLENLHASRSAVSTTKWQDRPRATHAAASPSTPSGKMLPSMIVV
jgi:hypothetical protein